MAGENCKLSDKRSALARGIPFFFLHHAKSCKIVLVVSVLFSFVVFLSFENFFPNNLSYNSYQTQLRTQARPERRLEVGSRRWFKLQMAALQSHKGEKSPVNFFARRLSEHIRHLPPSDLRRMRSPRDIIYRKPDSPVNYTEKRNFSELPKEMKLLRPMLFKDAPRKYLLDFKNPCYYGKYGGLECLPYFFLLGNPKCGTTDIWGKINGHPQIANSGKEPHWWTRGSLDYQSYPLSLYQRTFTTKAMVGMLRNKKANKSFGITGDGSASTFWDNQMWESLYPEYRKEGPPFVIADVIQAILPNAKLLVSFRDPTTRLYSGYVYFTLKRKETALAASFHDIVVSELNSFKTCTSNRSVRACAYSKSHGVRLQVGQYPVYTKDWLERFPRDQLMFLKLEEWGSNCTEILPKIYRFLEVSTLTSARIQEICSSKTRNTNAKNLEAVGPMLNKTRDLLRNFYRPYVKELADMLNDTRFLWDYLDT